MHTVLAIVPLTIAGASMLLIPGNLLGVAVIAYPYLAIAAIRAFKTVSYTHLTLPTKA